MYKYGQYVPDLSAQHALNCNFMNEGCAGGWPEFNGWFYEGGHLVSEDCAPYYGKTVGNMCQQYKSCAAKAKIKKSYHVGKGYGRVSEL